ncbi:hypothetical protein MRX96_039316, partial [Rhipicephalus microplus]
MQVLMFPGKSHGRFSVSHEGTLTISGVRKEDRGYYVCSALSVVGSSMTKGYLEVTVIADLPPPIIRLGPANQTLPVHTTAQLPCEAEGTPKPVVQWLYNGSPLNYEERRRLMLLECGMLQIKDLQMSDSDSSTFPGPPSPPMVVQGSKEYVEGFYIRFRDMSGGSEKYNIVTVLNGGALSYVLNDLRKFTKYQFFLVPFYRSVEGPPSNSRSVQTLEDVPTAPPDSVEVHVLNSTAAAIFWSPPATSASQWKTKRIQ